MKEAIECLKLLADTDPTCCGECKSNWIALVSAAQEIINKYEADQN